MKNPSGCLIIPVGCFFLLFPLPYFLLFCYLRLGGIVSFDDPAVLYLPITIGSGILGFAIVHRYRPAAWLFAVVLFAMGVCTIAVSDYLGPTSDVTSALSGLILMVPLIGLGLAAYRR